MTAIEPRSLKHVHCAGPFRIRSTKAGFTLIEVLVAFAILALVTLAVQRAVVTTVDGTGRAKNRLGAEMVAQTISTIPLLASAGMPAAMNGSLDGLAWTARFTSVELPFATQLSADGAAPQWRPVRMTIRVSSGRTRVAVDVIRLVRITRP